MRTFTFSDAKSHKFWNIDLKGAEFTVTYGKIGTAGQTQTKTFATPEKALAEHDKLVKEKLSKGYVETSARAVKSSREVLEEAIRSNPSDTAAHSAYADLLQEEGDPQGEFIRVQLALEDEKVPAAERKKLQKREAELLKEHERTWLGGLAPFLIDQPAREGYRSGDAYDNKHRFTRGLLTDLHFPMLKVAEARALSAAPQARFLRRLVITEKAYETPEDRPEQYSDGTFTPGPDIPKDATDDYAFYPLARCPHLAGLRVFQLGEIEDENYTDWCPFNCHMSGEQAHHLVKQMPRVEELYLLAHRVDGKKLFALPMPELRVLQLYHSTDYPLEKLAANASLANLTHLYCHPHAIEDEEPYIKPAGVRALVRSPHLKALTHLRLRCSNLGDRGVSDIVDSGILKRLKSLDLRHGLITDAGARALADCPDTKRLEWLDLSRNKLGADGVVRLEALGIRVNVSRQNSADTDEYEIYQGDIE